MAITDTAHDSTLITRFFGLSTDTKPVSAMIDATFVETDTRREFVFNGKVWVRNPLVTVEQASAVVVEEVLATDDLLSDILVQLRINNAYLAHISSTEINEEDL